MLTTMEAEPEVMGTPGRVRDMIARFSDLATPSSDNSVTKRNGTSPTSPTSPSVYDVPDNLIREPTEIRRALKPVNRDLGFGEPTHINNNDKIFRHELDTHHNEKSEDIKDSDNSLMIYRKKLRPVANSVIVTDNCVNDSNDVTHMDNDVTSPVTANGSEPSLLSRNGQRSSVTASKRTLVSQDTDPSPQKGDGGEHRASSQPTLLDTGMPATTMTSDMGYDAVETGTPKTPSYMKISCALSGYNRYNTYTSPKQEAKLKVLKLGEQNGSHSSLSSQQSDSSSSAAPAEVRTSDLNLKVVNDEHTTTTTTRAHEPMRNGVTNGEKLLNGSCNNGGDATTINGADTHVAIVTNGRTLLDDDDLDDDQHKFVTKAMVNLGPSDSPTLMPELRLPLEDKRKAELRSAVSTPSPSKDGYYYFPVLDREVSRIRALCIPCEAEMASNSLPEEACGKMRAAVGKSNLLINKKFEQFRGLCEQNINQAHDEAFRTTVTDLAGFWDMVSLQISDIDQSFADIEKMRQSGWKVIKDSPVKQPLKAGAKKSPRGKDTSTASSTPTKSAKSEEASRARDEARRRLLAAKRAGRQRKASQSDKDEIEIFVAE